VETPPVPWAIVFVNPSNGEKNLYVGADAYHVCGLSSKEGRTLLRDLANFTAQWKYTCPHEWHDDDVVVWDNRCSLHRRRTWDKLRDRRIRYRTIVAGNEPASRTGYQRLSA